MLIIQQPSGGAVSMSISVACTCGKKLSVKDEFAGKRGKCPACGAMLTIPQPVKPVPKPGEEEWGIAPIDDEKPGKAAPKPASGNTAQPPGTVPVKLATTPPTPVKSAPAKHASFVDDEFGLAPLDDDLFGKPAASAKPAPAAKPPVTAAPSQVRGGQPNSITAAASAAPAKKIPLGGPAPALLDLPPLDDDLFAKPAAAVSKQANSAKPPVSGAKTTSATSTTKSIGGAAPAPLDLPPLGDELAESTHAAWIDEGSESAFKIAGAPLPSATGQIFAPPPVAAPVNAPPGGYPGQLLCPYCNRDLERTVTTGNIVTQIVLGLFAGFYFTPTTPFRCRSCGPIKYEELVGESKQTAKKRAASMDRGCLYGALAVVGAFVFVLLALMYAAGDFDDSSTPPPAAIPSHDDLRRKEFDQQFEELKKRNEKRWRESEERRRANEERLKKMRQQNQQPATPRPNPAPRPNNSETPLPTPRPTPTPLPMQPVSPFEETTLPPMPAPPKTPMPVNPFQPID